MFRLLISSAVVAIALGVVFGTEAGSAATTAVTASPPANTAAPTISGTAQAGKTLTANPGSWGGTTPMTYSYYWRRCDSGGANCVVVSSVSSVTYTLGSSDVGKTLRVGVTATNSAGSGWVQSGATAVVAAAASTSASASARPICTPAWKARCATRYPARSTCSSSAKTPKANTPQSAAGSIPAHPAKRPWPRRRTAH